MERVLIVEDDLATGRILFNLVRSVSKEIGIDWYLSAEEAFNRMNQLEQEASQYKFAITDITLAGTVTGVELWKTYNKRKNDTKFLFISGMPKEAFFAHVGAQANSNFNFIQKPISIEEAKNIIRDAIFS